jgi:hypothetical protein
MDELCHSKLPLKIKNFMWLMHRNRMQTADNVERKQWKVSKLCHFCQVKENADHLFFRCSIVVFVWAV